MEFHNDKELSNNASRVPYPFTIEDADIYLERALSGADAGTEFAFVGLQNNEIVANSGLRLIEDGWSLGYAVHRNHRAKGYAQEIASAVCNFGFQELCEEIHASHFADNPVSGYILQKLGFLPTGNRPMIYSVGRKTEAETIDYTLSKRRYLGR